MNLLLDTHILLWALTDSEKMPLKAKKMIVDKNNNVFFSIASIWETEIKFGLGKLPVSGAELYKYCIDFGMKPVSINAMHISKINSLWRPSDAPRHNDPFDKLLIAQAKTESFTFITHDSLLIDYNESCILNV